MKPPPGYVRVYRAVSEEEFDQMVRTNSFEIVPWGSEGKHFADTVDGAKRFARLLMGEGRFRVIEADVPEAAPSLFRWLNLDGCGPCRFLDIDDLAGVLPRPHARRRRMMTAHVVWLPREQGGRGVPPVGGPGSRYVAPARFEGGSASASAAVSSAPSRVARDAVAGSMPCWCGKPHAPAESTGWR